MNNISTRTKILPQSTSQSGFKNCSRVAWTWQRYRQCGPEERNPLNLSASKIQLKNQPLQRGRNQTEIPGSNPIISRTSLYVAREGEDAS